MNVFDPVHTLPTLWEKSHLIESPKSGQIFIEAKPSHGSFTGCLLWIGREIQALICCRSKTYTALSKIKTLFENVKIEHIKNNQTYLDNINQFNDKLAKYNASQFWDSCKISFIDKSAISKSPALHEVSEASKVLEEGQIIKYLDIKELILRIERFLDLKSFINLQSSCRTFYKMDFGNHIIERGSKNLLSKCLNYTDLHGTCKGMRQADLITDFFFKFIQEDDKYDFDKCIELLIEAALMADPSIPPTSKILELVKWTKNKKFDSSFDQIILQLISENQCFYTDFLSRESFCLLTSVQFSLSITHFTEHLRLILQEKVERESALINLKSAAPMNQFLLSLNFAAKASDGEDIETLINIAEGFIKKIDKKVIQLKAFAFYSLWCKKNHRSTTLKEFGLKWDDIFEELKNKELLVQIYNIGILPILVENENQRKQLCKFFSKKIQIYSAPNIHIEFWMNLNKTTDARDIFMEYGDHSMKILFQYFIGTLYVNRNFHDSSHVESYDEASWKSFLSTLEEQELKKLGQDLCSISDSDKILGLFRKEIYNAIWPNEPKICLQIWEKTHKKISTTELKTKAYFPQSPFFELAIGIFMAISRKAIPKEQ